MDEDKKITIEELNAMATLGYLVHILEDPTLVTRPEELARIVTDDIINFCDAEGIPRENLPWDDIEFELSKFKAEQDEAPEIEIID